MGVALNAGFSVVVSDGFSQVSAGETAICGAVLTERRPVGWGACWGDIPAKSALVRRRFVGCQ
jgi:hypothetical protein